MLRSARGLWPRACRAACGGRARLLSTSLSAQLDSSAAAVHAAADGFQPEIAMILGSGLGVLADEVGPVAARIGYGDIPHMPQSTVEGHAGELVLGELAGRQVAVLSGRIHAYEGRSFERLVYPLRLMAQLGCRKLLVTNACGGIREDLAPGHIMLISDHINMLGSNPLLGPNDDSLGPRFPDMSSAYTPALREHARAKAAEANLEVKEGVYLAALGPSYETPAEIRMMRTLGADVVGMSTAPEVIAASHMGVEVLGMSLVTNHAAGVTDQPLSHDEVVEEAALARDRFASLIHAILPGL